MGDRRGHVFSSVADKTEGIAALDQQNRVLRGMRGMTGNALSFRKGLMLDGTAGLEIGRLVAFLAKFGALLSVGKGVLGCSRVVAFCTIQLGHR